jgi:tripartite-type tricarboxylate transporter receptor subunit TctC
MANASVPVKTLSDVIALAKKGAGQGHDRQPAAADAQLLWRRAVQAMTGIDVSIVTYKGTGPLTNDLVGGHVMLAFNTCRRRSATSRPASSTPSRSARPSALPPSPTCRPRRGRAAGARRRALLRARRARRHAAPIIERLNKELRAIVTSDEFKKRIVADGGGPAPSTPEEHASNMAREEGKWNAMIKKLGLKLE